MKYNFLAGADRRHTDCAKWDEFGGDFIPLWVADMDFNVAPCITEAINKRNSHPIFGYAFPGDDWYEAWINFIKDRHGFEIKKEWMFFATGVIPIVSSTVRKMSKEGDNVLLLTPIYGTFFNSIVNNNRIPLESKMIYKDGEYHIDWKDLEEKMSLDNTPLMIFCNPHNPTGQLWDKETMMKIGELAYKHHVVVLSDEIHSELTDPGVKYIPYASVNDINKNNSIIAISTSKWFNLASIQAAMCYIPNEEIKKKVERQLNTDECAEPNAFACPVTVAALNNGREWLDEAREVIKDNKDFMVDYIKNNIPDIEVIRGKATYMSWLNVSKFTADSNDLCQYLLKKHKVLFSPGTNFRGDGINYLRINVACPRSQLIEGLNRFKEGIIKYKNERNR